jgi:hypothetical protein
MRRRRFILALAIMLGVYVTVWAQQSTITVPLLHQNVSQWGGAAMPAAATLNDSISNPIAPLIGSTGLVWDAAGWVRRKATSLTNMVPAATLTVRSQTGAALVEKSARWMVVHNPAASSQATASIAAEASVRHVADCISFSAGSTTAPALTALTVNLRDGATGAGTIIWTHEVIIGAATGQNVVPYGLCGLSLTGTTNTAMTLEFSASLANLIEAVSISGLNVQ